MVQQTVQVILTTIWTLFASPIAGAITPQGWYGLGAGLAGLQFIVAFFLLPETKYDRDLSAYQEWTGAPITPGDDVEATKSGKPAVVLCKQRPALDFVRYQPRTWKSDMRLWIGRPEWHKAAEVIKVCPQYTRVKTPLIVNAANVPTVFLPKRLLGPMSKWSYTWRQCRHGHNIRQYPHSRPVQLARHKCQLRQLRTDHRSAHRTTPFGHRI